MLTHLFVLVFPALVMPISRDLNLAPADVIGIGFPMYLCFGILAIPWGYLSDRTEPRLMMGIGMLISGAGYLLAGLAASVDTLGIYLIMVGVGCSAYHPCGLSLLSKGCKARGRALGINGMWGNLGIAGAPLAAGVLTFFAGWQSSLLFFGFLGIVTGAACFVVPLSLSSDDLQKGKKVAGKQAVTLFLILCGVMIFSGLMYRGYTVTLPRFFEAKLQESRALLNALGSRDTPDSHTLLATVVTSLVYLVGIAGQLLGGKVADRYDLRKAYLVFFSSAAPFLIALYFVEGVLLIPLTAVFVMFALGMQPIENSLIAMLTPPRWRSVSYGIKFTLVFGAGSLAVKLVGHVENRFGLDSVILLLVLFLFMVIAGIAILLAASRGMSVRHEH
jgi:MFS family permease